jgi:hypothetical protein
VSGRISRVYALTNTASGVAGEAAVTAALLRAGLRVARPLWTDDEIDLLVFWQDGAGLIPIPVQVKSVQAPSGQNEAQAENLKKRYLEKNPYLCLAIYSVSRNKIWLIPKSENIQKVYSEWADAPKTGPGRPRMKYNDIPLEKGTLDIRVDVSKSGNKAFDDKWLIDMEYADRLTRVFVDLAKEIRSDKARVQALTDFVFEGSGSVSLIGAADLSMTPATSTTSEPTDTDDGLDVAVGEDAEAKLAELRTGPAVQPKRGKKAAKPKAAKRKPVRGKRAR